MQLFKNIYQFIFGPCPAQQFKFFMRLFVLTFLLYMMHRFGYAYERLTDRWFHYTNEIKASWQFSPLPLLPSWAVLPFACFVFATLLLYLIWRKQKYLIRLIFFISVYTQFIDQAAAFTLNKYYTVFFLLAALAYEYIDDTWKRVVTAWPVRVIQATFLIQYFTAATCKVLHGDWLKETNILRTQVQGLYCNDFAALLIRNLPKEFRTWSEHAAFFFELTAPFFLIAWWLLTWKKVRRWAAIFWWFWVLMLMTSMFQMFGISENLEILRKYLGTFLIAWSLLLLALGRFKQQRRLFRFVFLVGRWFHIFIALSMKNLIYFSQQLMVMYVLFFTTSEFERIMDVLKWVGEWVRKEFLGRY